MKHVEREITGGAGAAAEQRRRGIFTAALAIFARYGFRKTSMDEVARAAEISRQGLYLHFATKEELFRALVAHVLETGLAAAGEALRNPALPLERRLAGAFDEWMGRHVGMVGAEAADLIQAANSLMGDEIRGYEKRFCEAVTAALRRTELASAFSRSGVTARQLTGLLLAVARGHKCHCGSRAEFTQEFAVALRVLFTAAGGAGRER